MTRAWRDHLRLALLAIDAELEAISLLDETETIGEARFLRQEGKHALFQVFTGGQTRDWNRLSYMLKAKRPKGRAAEINSPLRIAFHGRHDGVLTVSVNHEDAKCFVNEPAVQVLCTRDPSFDQMNDLKSKLQSRSRHNLTEDMFNGVAPEVRPLNGPTHDMNAEQSRAVRTILEPGAHFVWGPPGTGKSRVITRVAQRALAAGKSVLITSHSNRSVDEAVLQSIRLVEQDLGESAAGKIVRIGEAGEIQDDIRIHPYALLHKAAERITEASRRADELMIQKVELESSPNIKRLAVTKELLEALQGRYAGLAPKFAARSTVQVLRNRRSHTLGRMLSCSDEITTVHGRLKTARLQLHSSEQMAAAREQLEGIDERITQLETKKANATAALERAESGYQVAVERQAALDGTWFSRARKRQTLADNVERQGARRYRAAEWVTDLAARLKDENDERDLLVAQIQGYRSEGAAVQELGEEVVRLDSSLATLISKLWLHSRDLSWLEEQVIERSELADSITSVEDDIWQEPARRDWEELTKKEAELTKLVDELQYRLKQVDDQLSNLADEKDDEVGRLYREAPVVGASFSTLVSDKHIGSRTFDIVIIDDACGGFIPEVMLACTHAGSSIAALGDFQIDSPGTRYAREDIRRQLRLAREVAQIVTNTIFERVGLATPEAAIESPTCCVLLEQFRYSASTVKLLNDFAYSGTMQACDDPLYGARPATILVDTGSLPMDVGTIYTYYRSAWWQAGLDVAQQVLRLHESREIKIVVPYIEQVNRLRKVPAIELGLMNGKLQIVTADDASTNSRADVVLFDMMQDQPQERLIGRASFTGSPRQMRAAIGANRALTGARQHLYLVGDWRFIRGSTQPLMRALVNQVRSGSLKLVAAEQLLSNTA